MYILIAFYYIVSLFNDKARSLVRGQRLTLTSGGLDGLDGCVWFHAASVGEFEQARPIIERLKREHPDRKILVTFFSPSGYGMRKDYPLADAVRYLPFATRRNAVRFLDAVQPSVAVFVKYEFWPAYLRALKKRAVPTYIIDAIFRPEQPFFRWWGRVYRRLLRCFTAVFVQDERSRALLERFGIDNAVVAGDTRFDRVNEICAHPKVVDIVQRFVQPAVTPLTDYRTTASGVRGIDGGPWEVNASEAVGPSVKVIVAGSTWPPDERLLERYVREHDGVRLVMVPHELTSEHLHVIFNMFQGRFVRLSEATPQNVIAARTLLVDCMGLLSSLYKYASVAYVGGGFGVGIHNTIEPAVFGVPVLFGPNNKRFREAQDMLENGAARTFTDYRSFERAMDEALADYKAIGRLSREYVHSELGAADKIYDAVF